MHAPTKLLDIEAQQYLSCFGCLTVFSFFNATALRWMIVKTVVAKSNGCYLMLFVHDMNMSMLNNVEHSSQRVVEMCGCFGCGFASNLPHLALWLLFLWLICLGQHECTQVEQFYHCNASSNWSRLPFILCIYIYICMYSVAVKFPPYPALLFNFGNSSIFPLPHTDSTNSPAQGCSIQVQIAFLLLMDKILHHQGWWLSHYL